MHDDYRNDADLEMAALEAAGRAAMRGRRRMLAQREAGNLSEAARHCHHGSGYPTNSPAASHSQDPRAGQPGMRCTDCGSYWSTGTSLYDMRDTAPEAPCELYALTHNPIADFAAALNPPGGALADSLPFTLTADRQPRQQAPAKQGGLFKTTKADA